MESIAMTDRPPEQATLLLERVAAGEPHAAEELLPLVYSQLRAIASQRMRDERAGHTLQATALVHEAFMKLVGDRAVPWGGRAHFFAAAAEAMRQILIDHARGRGRQKRGGDRRRVPLSIVDLSQESDPDQVLALDDAFRRLEAREPDVAQIVRLRFYAGLTIEEVATLLELSDRTVNRKWVYARAWLARELSVEGGQDEAAPATGE